jgi:LPXTG-motif cell wall-anchored protein
VTVEAMQAGGLAMDFFERYLGLFPDEGNGSTEMLYLLAAALILVAVIGLLWRRRNSRPVA